MNEPLTNVEIAWNDIQHHQQYVNGYAISPGSGARVHHNRITSTGRGIHVTGEYTEVFDNYIDIRGHQHLSDLPENTRPFHHRLIELHGIKFEGSKTKYCKVYHNFVRIIQPQPADSEGRGDPAHKQENGIYFRSKATSVEKGRLIDITQRWEKDRWRYYFLKYDSKNPAVMITGNDDSTLYGNFDVAGPVEYTIYMKWNYVPPTPLNIACYNPNGMNEVYENTFIGITTHHEVRHGGYGDAGQWATALMFVGMDKGSSESGKYAVAVYNNRFISNDLFVNAHSPVTMKVLVKNNTFQLSHKPFSIARKNRFLQVGKEFVKHLSDFNKVIY